MISLRPHHLLCLCLFNGNGYSDLFVQNMRCILDQLTQQKSVRFLLVSDGDDICAQCPNLTARKDCALGEVDVRRMDCFVADLLELRYHQSIEYADVIDTLKCKITQAHFDTCCAACRWHMEEYCTYEKLRDRLR